MQGGFGAFGMGDQARALFGQGIALRRFGKEAGTDGFLQPGDAVACTIDAIGTLSNPVVAV